MFENRCFSANARETDQVIKSLNNLFHGSIFMRKTPEYLLMSENMDQLFLSPSLYHRSLLEKHTPSLSFSSHLHEAEKHSQLVRKKFLELLRVDLSNRPAEVPWKSLGRKRCPWGTIEKVVFRSCDCCDVPGFLCLPDHPVSDTIFICLQGHSGDGIHVSISASPENWNEEKPAAGDRDFAFGCLKRGIAAFCPEQSCFGERLEKVQEKRAKSFCHDAFVQALLLGKTLMGERVYDVARSIDFLKSRPETANMKIGIMGNSGGGTVSVYSAAVLPEIDFCMPSCSFGTYAGSKMRVYQCGCGYIPGILEFMEMDDVMALFAPKPVVIVAGKEDPIIPLESVTTGFERLKQVYAVRGAQEHCHLVIGSEGHRFYADAAWEKMLPEVLNG